MKHQKVTMWRCLICGWFFPLESMVKRCVWAHEHMEKPVKKGDEDGKAMQQVQKG